MLTNEQKEYILENYKNNTSKEIAKKINATRSQVTNFLNKNNLYKKGKWNKNEDNFILSNYVKMSYKEIAQHLNRTESAVQQRAKNTLGISKTKSDNWTAEELEYLKEHIKNDSYETIRQHLNRRTYSAIYNKVWELNLIPNDMKRYKKVKQEQIYYILNNCDRMTDFELGKKFGISAEAVSEIRKKHNIIKTNSSSHKITYIEKFIKEQLDILEIPYVFNQPLNRFVPDFQLENKTIIEVNGDYYHCNPSLYPDGPKDEVQIRHIIQDYYKKCFYVSNKYTVYYFWENDIVKNPEEIIRRLKEIKSALYK